MVLREFKTERLNGIGQKSQGSTDNRHQDGFQEDLFHFGVPGAGDIRSPDGY